MSLTYRQSFRNLARVKELSASGTAVDDQIWIQSFPLLQREFIQARRSRKLAFARPLAHALSMAGLPLASDLVQSLYPPGTQRPNSVDFRIPLDLDPNTPDSSPISEEQLDELLSRFTSRAFWCCTGYGGHRAGSYTEISVSVSAHKPHWSGITVSSTWIGVLGQILVATRIEDGAGNEVEAKLEELGAAFQCRSTTCHSPNPRMTFTQLVSRTNLLLEY
jgi:hypothetical protein